MHRHIGPSIDQDHVRLLSLGVEDPATKPVQDLSDNEPSPLELELKEALSSIRKKIGPNKRLREFLEPAEKEWAALVSKYARELAEAALQCAARRSGATAVDQGDVERADGRVSGRKGELKAWLLGVAGVFAGLAGNSAIGMMLTPPSSHGTFWAIGTVGFVAMSLALFIYANPRRS